MPGMESFNTQPPEGGWVIGWRRCATRACFNTQPPEGGWQVNASVISLPCAFQHTAARRRLAGKRFRNIPAMRVSTHSRPKAAGWPTSMYKWVHDVSTHSRPKAAGFNIILARIHALVSTHSRPKAAGCLTVETNYRRVLGFNTQPPEGGWQVCVLLNAATASFQHTAARRRLGVLFYIPIHEASFQHTAARRRLESFCVKPVSKFAVSTHSRPKAAGSQ